MAFDSLLDRPTRTAGYAGGGEVKGVEVDWVVVTGYWVGGEILVATASFGLTTVGQIEEIGIKMIDE